jgi:hypothetical protein
MFKPLPPRNEITPDMPLRLTVAAALAFPGGPMSASGLRREVFMLASVCAKLGTSWRDGAIIKRVL